MGEKNRLVDMISFLVFKEYQPYFRSYFPTFLQSQTYISSPNRLSQSRSPSPLDAPGLMLYEVAMQPIVWYIEIKDTEIAKETDNLDRALALRD